MSLKMIFLNFILSVAILSAQEITKGPYLVQPDGSSLTIRWETNYRVEQQFLFGLVKEKLTQLPVSFSSENHQAFLYEVRLSNLIPETTYYYKIMLSGNPGKIHQFKSAPPPAGKLTFVAMGDSRSNPPVFTAITNRIQETGPDLVISMGDLVANGGAYTQWQDYYFGIVQQLITHVPVVSCLGDHEGDDDSGELFCAFFMPESNRGRLWFSFDYGPAHFVALDYRYPNDSRMKEWFQDDMRRSTAKWNFVYMHRPCYNLGGHRSHWGSPHWPELFARYRIDMVFAGHSHQYERFFPAANAGRPDSWPVTYITTGGAGAGTYEVVESEFLAAAAAEHHFVTIKISGDTLHFEAHRADGSNLDQFQLVKHNEEYDQEYLAIVKSRAALDLINMFSNRISFALKQIPLEERPAGKNLQLINDYLNERIFYQILLSSESEPFYRMASYQDTLWHNQLKMVPLQIFSTQDVCVSGWGDIDPPLRLQVKFRCGNEEYKIVGGKAEYWPDEEY